MSKKKRRARRYKNYAFKLVYPNGVFPKYLPLMTMLKQNVLQTGNTTRYYYTSQMILMADLALALAAVTRQKRRFFKARKNKDSHALLHKAF